MPETCNTIVTLSGDPCLRVVGHRGACCIDPEEGWWLDHFEGLVDDEVGVDVQVTLQFVVRAFDWPGAQLDIDEVVDQLSRGWSVGASNWTSRPQTTPTWALTKIGATKSESAVLLERVGDSRAHR